MAEFNRIQDRPKRKKQGKLLEPKLTCGPGDNCKCACNTAINLIHSILSDGTNPDYQAKVAALRKVSVDPGQLDI